MKVLAMSQHQQFFLIEKDTKMVYCPPSPFPLLSKLPGLLVLKAVILGLAESAAANSTPNPNKASLTMTL